MLILLILGILYLAKIFYVTIRNLFSSFFYQEKNNDREDIISYFIYKSIDGLIIIQYDKYYLFFERKLIIFVLFLYAIMFTYF